MIYVEITVVVYLLFFIYHFMSLRAIILDNYSELGWHAHRGKIFLRSICWFIPASIYYWKDAKWEREKNQYE